jgi:tetratricopeptide (TPR) repeat protein
MRIEGGAMKTRFVVHTAAAAAIALAVATALQAQSVTLPPDGDNQKASVSQWIGLVEVGITYHSPDVTAPDGSDRKGKIWGQLVPYGMAKESFGTCGDTCPWRAGANENTVFRVSHDVKVEGQPLAAGSYGLFMIPGQDEWTIIFSKNSTSWGAYYYDPAEDALRVKVKPAANEYTHWLTYEFTDRQPDRATVALKWELLRVPWTIVVDNLNDLYVENMRRELRTSPGFSWQAWEQAARFCFDRKVNLKEGLTWAQNAVSLRFIGQENFTTLRTLADLQAANGLAAEAEKSTQKALEHPTASMIDLHQYGRQLLTQGEKEKALKVFELNARRHPDVWPVNVGLARGYAAVGRTQEALKAAKAALLQAPDDVNRKNLEKMIADLQVPKPAK